MYIRILMAAEEQRASTLLSPLVKRLIASRSESSSFRVLFPNQVIRADDLARAMVHVAVSGTGERRSLVLENRDIRAMIESLHQHPPAQQ